MVLEEITPWVIAILLVVALFDGVLKLIAMWKSAGRKQLAWFIVLAIVNSAGILPIIYLIIYRDQKKAKKKKK